MGRVTYTGVLALVLLALVAAPAGAQVFIDTSEQRVELRPGTASTFQVNFTNPTDRPYFVAGQPFGNLSDQVTLDPNRFPLPANETRTAEVTIRTPKETPFDQGRMGLRFTIVDRQTGQPIEQVAHVQLHMDRPEIFLGLYENPLPPPFEDAWGMFAAELLSWALIAFVLVSLLGFVIREVVPNAESMVQEKMAAMVKAPVFYLIVVLGVNFSWRLVPASPAIEMVDRLLDAVAVVVAAVLAYRATGAGLYYYGQNIAGKTETKVDDVLVPVLEKLSAAIIIGLAAFYTFQVLGVDLSFLLAGGLVAGLVISMAAQDTLSNFFSGLYLLIDRPFREGNDIELETGEICRVDHVGMRSSRLYHYRNHQQIIVPNNDLATKRVVNLSYPDEYYRIVLEVGVAYDSDLDKVRKVLHNVAMENEDVQKGRTTAPRAWMRSFGDSSIGVELRAYVGQAKDRNPVRSDLIVAIHKAFAEEGIEIPFPQRVLWHKELKANGAPEAAERVLQAEATIEVETPEADGDEGA